MEIICEFDYVNLDSSPPCYTCIITEANIKKENHLIKEIRGAHRVGRTHGDVKCVRFINTTVDHFPRGLEKHFPNLTHLFIRKCSLKEVSKNDLKGLERLVFLSIFKCQLTTLPNDLLKEMTNLRTVTFDSNKIEFVSSELLRPLQGKQNVQVSLYGNKVIDACFWPGDVDSMVSLEDLMKLIDETCIKPLNPMDFNPKIKELWQSGRFSDIKITTVNKVFKAHKNILGMQSSVFAQIFEDQVDATEIKIPDFSSKSVEALLKFIYTAEVTNDGNAKEYFLIAGKFKVAAMKTKYEEIILS